jgi:3-keto-5-aminohexanoate cleavage enzyme
MKKLIITAAVVGAEVMKNQQPALPITPEEIANDVYDCWRSGASIVHLHVRDKDGNPTQDENIFKETVRLIRERTNIIVQVSTGGSVSMTPEERIQSINCDPEMATLSAGTCNFGDEVFYNPYNLMVDFAKKMQNKNILPEIEVFDTGMVNNALKLCKDGYIKGHLHFDFVLGVPGAMPASVKNLLFLSELIPQEATWSVAGIGRHEAPMAAAAIIMGGHVRVGFEDNIYYKKGRLAKSNSELIQRVVRIAKELNRDIATPDEAREILGIKK